MNPIPKHLRNVPDSELEQLAQEYNIELPKEHITVHDVMNIIREAIIKKEGDVLSPKEIDVKVFAICLPLYLMQQSINQGSVAEEYMRRERRRVMMFEKFMMWVQEWWITIALIIFSIICLCN